MSFLFVAQRELRVSSRRKSTYFIRGVAALLGIAISGFYMLMFAVGIPSSVGLGRYMFTVLSWYTLLTTLMAGVFLASDCLSEERREGTLGLLFLTDLKGYEVVLGKFMAVSLNAFYGLLAVFPVLGLCLLTGGVAGAEFWRTCLALLNLLFFSVTASILVLSFCQSSNRAMSGSLALLVIWLIVTSFASATSMHEVKLMNPFETFLLASDAEYLRQAREFWESLAISHLMGWVFLAWAARRLRTFVDKGEKRRSWPRFLTWDILGSSASRRARLLDINPMLWLLDDSRRLRAVTWLLALAAVVVLICIVNKGGPMALAFGSYALWPFYFLLKVFIAIQACRFFVEARRTGALELLCCTPLTMRAIVAGQWMLLRRVFMWPLIVLLSAHLAALIYSATRGAGIMGAAGSGGFPLSFVMFYYYFKVIPNSVADFFAIGWFGMWLALYLQRPNMAVGLTILSVVILPMVAVCVPALAIDAIFIAIGWVKLSEDFRLRQAQWATRKPVS